MLRPWVTILITLGTFVSSDCFSPNARAQALKECGLTNGAAITRSPTNPKINILTGGDGKVGPSIFVVANKFAVNTDGSPRSYHPTDPDGTKFAINTVCHASVLVFDNGKNISCYEKSERTTYYDVFQRFVSERGDLKIVGAGYDPSSDPQYKVGGDYGLDLDEPEPPGEDLVEEEKLAEESPLEPRQLGDDYVCHACKNGNCEVCFTKHIIKMNGDPCVRDKGKYKGYFVNLLSIEHLAKNKPDPANVDGANADNAGCRQPIRLDAELLPGIVLPSGKLAPIGKDYAARKGDIAIAYNVKTSKWALTVVSDSGPSTDFGEGSIAANKILKFGYKREWPRPKKYKDALALHISNKVAILLFPGSAAKLKGDYSPANTALQAKKLFEGWGGGSLTEARRKFRSCLTQMPQSFEGKF